jgi:Na+-transporting methylmalonyl-CoA/oxaloacetate decarboxylase gamma subunit
MIALFTDIIDKGGDTVTIVSFLVVFCSLTILYMLFAGLSKLLLMKARKNMKKEGEAPVAEVSMEVDVNVAIAMALYMYFNELHDNESNIITIQTAPKQYSPWNSKIYGVMNQPVKK